MSAPLKNLRAKLASTRGDSMVEALAALLIAVMAATLLATMVMTSTSVASSSKQALRDVYAAESAMAEIYASGDATVSLGTISAPIKVKTYQSTDENGNVVFTRYENVSWRPEDMQ